MIPVRGVFAASVTARRPGTPEPDLASTLDVLDFLGAAGLEGAAMLGATGEYLDFSLEDRRRLIAVVARRSPLPLVVNVSHPSLEGAVRLAQESQASGAAAVMLMPPAFFHYDAEEIRQYYIEFATRTDLATPRLIYNLPFFTDAVPIELSEELLATGQFQGIKDSSGNEAYFERLAALRKQHEFSLLTGNDVMFVRGHALGSDGVISGCACAVPELTLALNRALGAADEAKYASLNARLQEFIAQIDAFPTPVGIREACGARGLRVGSLAVPLSAGLQKRLAAFREWFLGWLPQVRRESSAG